ncbi:protein HESO1-like isoform X4 [Primulina eburnea]|uniref:protein HESO1-like isoform X4 n=1 Tax=Primulina eburnea TaxID=1245227 RepID=UPI003C6C16D9
MNGYSSLELILKDILLAINPSREDWSVRFHTIKELQAVVESIENLRDGWGRIQFISNARVPILKLVKEWAKAHNINDPKSGTLNSYSLSLLVVYHLQTLEPAILPPLREIYPGNMIEDLTGVRAAAVKHIEDICAVNINRFKSNRSRLMINRSSLAELFISFLAKFADICSRASEQGISPFSGRRQDIYSNMRWLPYTHKLFVEDPFEQPENTARTVSSNQMKMIVEAIQATRSVIMSPRQKKSKVCCFISGQVAYITFSS